ncbi:MAG: hypothetical protein WKF59_00790 [Chitinophagaceae bacterium]
MTEWEEINKISGKNKIEKVIQIYKNANVDDWAKELKDKYYKIAMHHLEETAVLSARKKSLMELAEYLINREH